MKITKNFPGLKETDWSFELEGDLISDEEIEIDLGSKWLVVKGSIITKNGFVTLLQAFKLAGV